MPNPGYSRGDSATLWVTAEGILPLSDFQRGCYNFQGYSRGDATTLWVTAEGMLPLSQLGYCRRDTSTVCLSEGMLPLVWLQQRGHCLSVTEYTPCISIYTIYLYKYTVYLYICILCIYIYCRYIGIYIYKYLYIFAWPTGM